MTKEELLTRLNDIEWDDFEVKEASGGFPKSMWETVSAFSNTAGGWIILGVKERKTENGSEFIVNGVANPEHNPVIPSSETFGKRRIWNRQNIGLGKTNWQDSQF